MSFIQVTREDGSIELRNEDYDEIVAAAEIAKLNPAPEVPAEVLAALTATRYQRQRAAEYPPFADYLDGVVKGDQAQIDAYIAACQAVKAKYPKPESV
jgi:hypothetical protein